MASIAMPATRSGDSFAAKALAFVERYLGAGYLLDDEQTEDEALIRMMLVVTLTRPL